MNKIYSVTLWLLIIGICCHSPRNGGNTCNQIKTLGVYSKIQMINPDGFKLISSCDTFYISYYRQQRVFHVPTYLGNLKSVNTDSGMVLQNDLGESKRFQYCYYKQQSRFGTLYGIGSNVISDKVNVDSILNTKVPVFSNIIDPDFDSLVKVNIQSGLRTEYYIAIRKPDASFADTVVLSFSTRLKDIPFSFSEKMDEERAMKLCGIMYIYKSYFNSAYKHEIPRREISVGIISWSDERNEFVRSLFADKN